MNPHMLRAFRDEMEKIAGIASSMKAGLRSAGVVSRQLVDNPVGAVKSGWNSGYRHGMGWNWSRGRIGRHMPGGKTLAVASGVAGAPEAFKKEDPTGQGRTRAKRLAAWAGQNVGGIAGSRHGIGGAIAGGVVGEVAARSAVNVGSAAARPLRRPKPVTQLPVQEGPREVSSSP